MQARSYLQDNGIWHSVSGVTMKERWRICWCTSDRSKSSVFTTRDSQSPSMNWRTRGSSSVPGCRILLTGRKKNLSCILTGLTSYWLSLKPSFIIFPVQERQCQWSVYRGQIQRAVGDRGGHARQLEAGGDHQQQDLQHNEARPDSGELTGRSVSSRCKLLLIF